jgi:hypothetical protein
MSLEFVGGGRLMQLFTSTAIRLDHFGVIYRTQFHTLGFVLVIFILLSHTIGLIKTGSCGVNSSIGLS